MIEEKLRVRLKEALKKGASAEATTLRGLLAALANERIAKRGQLSEEDEVRVLLREKKKREEAIELYRRGGRKDLVEKEEGERRLIEEFLPKMLGEEEVRKEVEVVVAEMGEGAAFGPVMGRVMAKLRGKAEGSLVSRIVKEVLAQGER